MKRTTISLPDDLSAALEREARRRGVPVSQVAREAIEERLGRTEKRRLSFIGLGRSGQRDNARNIEEILKAEWTLDRDP
jgi:hypothetical protein